VILLGLKFSKQFLSARHFRCRCYLRKAQRSAPPRPSAMDNVLAFGIDGTMTAARHREAAGRFHLGHAIALCAAGEALRARGAVGGTGDSLAARKALALDCEALAAVW
jgi:hypothetical protein